MSMNGDIEILGCRLKLKTHEETNDLSSVVEPREVIELLEREIQEVRKTNPALEDSKTAVLVALKLASEKIELENEFRDQIEHIEKSARGALEIVSMVATQE